MILSVLYHPSDETAVFQGIDRLNHFKSNINNLAAEGIPFFFLIDFEMEKPVVFPLECAAEMGVFFDYRGKTNCSDQAEHNNLQNPITNKQPISFEKYSNAFSVMQNHLHAGNSYLANLTFASLIELEADLKDIFYDSTALYRLLYKDEFVQFSPESFIRIENGRIYSFPMKGTIDASIPDAENVILSDEKESWEHNTIVDLIRNDLSIVAENVKVKRFRYIDRLKSRDKNLLQVSSEIIGILPDNWQKELGDILLKLLPAGSISGAPKKKTLEIIKTAEDGKRGYYTGVSGVFDGKNLDSAVNIRFIEKKDKKFYFRSGGGITSSSNIDNEYRELIDKVNVPSND